VKRALVGCCQQLRQLLHDSLAKREMNEKRKLLVKYALCRSLSLSLSPSLPGSLSPPLLLSSSDTSQTSLDL
jgi:hypothetical protein